MSAEDTASTAPEERRSDAAGPVPDLSRSLELVELIRGGDEGAWTEFFARYRARLARIVRIKMGPRLQRHLDADDILQEVFLVALRRMREFEPRDHAGILQWLARVAENRIRERLDHHDAEKRHGGRDVPLARDSATSRGVRVAVHDPSPTQEVVRSELEELVDAAVEALEPEEYRAVILQRDYFLEEWEVVRARLERPSLEAVQELYRRAHRKLREKLRPHLRD